MPSVIIHWLGTRHDLDIQETAEHAQISTSLPVREFTEAEYAAMGGSATVIRVTTCGCPAVRIILPDETILEAAHSDALWDGDEATGITLTVTRISDTPFVEARA